MPPACQAMVGSSLIKSIKDDRLLKDFSSHDIMHIIMLACFSVSQIGWDVRTFFLAGLGITGILIGFALKDESPNFAAGLVLSFTDVKAGETIEGEGTQGAFVSLTIVNCKWDYGWHSRPHAKPKVWGAKITTIR